MGDARDTGPVTAALPPQVRAGMCAASLQDMGAAMERFDALLGVDPAEFADLYLEVGDLLVEQRRPDEVYDNTASLAKSSHLREYEQIANIPSRICASILCL